MKVTNAVIDWLECIWQSDLPPHSKFLAAYLRTYMNSKRSLAWCGVKRIARDTSLSKPTVLKYLTVLEDKQWLTIERTDGGARSMTNRYKIRLPDDLQVVGVNDIDPTSKALLPVGVKDVDTNIQSNKQSNKQLKKAPPKKAPAKLPEKISVDNAMKARNYWHSKNMIFDEADEWLRFTAYHESRNTKVTNFDAAWRTWYCNAVKYRKEATKSDKPDTFTRLQDTSWADGIK